MAPSYTISDVKGVLYTSSVTVDGIQPLLGAPPMAFFPADGVLFSRGLFVEIDIATNHYPCPNAAAGACNITVVVYTSAST